MLLCTDFDGTLRDLNDPNILIANLKALSAWRKAGNLDCLVTGRNFSVMPDILPDWQQHFDYLITDNGGATFSNQGELISRCRFLPGDIEIILEIIPEDVLPVYYFVHNYTTNRNRYPTDIPIKLRLWFHTLERLWFLHHRLESSSLRAKSLPWPKPGFSPLDGVDLSQYCGFLDIVPQVSGKEIAIQRLVNKRYPQNNVYDIKTHRKTHVLDTDSKIITVGDDFNDVAMLSTFEGYAIADSPPDVIQAASGRTVSSVAELVSNKMSSP